MTDPLTRLQTLLDIATGVTTNKDEARNAAFAACRLILEQRLSVALFVEEAKIRVSSSEPRGRGDPFARRSPRPSAGTCSCGPVLETLGIHAPGCPMSNASHGQGPDDHEVVFVAIQGPLVGGGRDVHLLTDLPITWPSAAAIALCGKPVRSSRGGSYMRITRGNIHTFKSDLFHTWPTSLLCAQCASVQIDRGVEF